MPMFDSIINETAERFNLGGKTGIILSALLTLMTNKNRGGFAGFLERFRAAGLGDTVTSWISSGSNTPVSNAQLEAALGKDTLENIADQTGTDYGSATSATAYMIPRVIDALTPNGAVPADGDLLSRIGGYLTGAAAAGGIGTAAAMTGDKYDTTERAVGDRADVVGDGYTSKRVDGDSNGGGSFLNWLLPLLLLGLVLASGYALCGRSSAPVVTNTNVSVNANRTALVVNNNSAVRAVDSSFTIKADNGKYAVTGIVPDEATRKQIVDALTEQYGAGNVDFAGLRVDAAARPFAANWWSNISQMLPNLKDWKTGELSFVGSAITAASGLPQAAIDQLKSLFGTGWRLPVSLAGAETAAKQANEAALNELASAGTVEEVVTALNLSIINFASGSSAIPADAQPILQKAAEVLKREPEGAVIEIGGHTDSDGNDAANLKLSQARADSVKKALVALGVRDAGLTAKGYGETAPVAANDTPDNKFKNRRIEYKTGAGNAPTATTTTTTTNVNGTTTNTNAAR